MPWAARTPVSAHVLRHAAITAIGRIGGYPVALAFAGHTPATVTGRYLHATPAEVAAAVAAMTGDPIRSPPPPSRAQVEADADDLERADGVDRVDHAAWDPADSYRTAALPGDLSAGGGPVACVQAITKL